jgi:hypothetical protein
MRFSPVMISGLMALVAFVAVALGGFRSGSEQWFRSLYTTTVGAVLVAAIAAKCCRRPTSSFAFAFAASGLSYLILGLGIGPMGVSATGNWEDNDKLVNGFLLSTSLIKRLFVLTSNYSDLGQIARYGYSVAVGHLIVTWLLAALGGAAAVFLTNRRSRAVARHSPTVPAAGRRSGESKWLKVFWTLTFLAVFSPIAVPVMHRSERPYFPDAALFSWDDDSRQLKEQISRLLEVVGEPSLEIATPDDRGVEVYRYLRLTYAQPPVCIRVQRTGDSVTLRYVVVDGLWPERFGIIAVDRSLELSTNQWRELNRRVAASNFWTLNEEKEARWASALTWSVFEGLRNQQHHVIGVKESNDDTARHLRILQDYLEEITGFGFD